MTDLGATIAPKSDQLNADDLIAGPRTIRITKVYAISNSNEQPIAISFDGDDGKPYKPCKSMRRVLVEMWGRHSGAYIGRFLTLYRDPSVRFGGIEVGGIRISHMSNIDAPKTMALTATRASRKPFTVKPLAKEKPVSETPAGAGTKQNVSASVQAKQEALGAEPPAPVSDSSAAPSPPVAADDTAGAPHPSPQTAGAPATSFVHMLTDREGNEREFLAGEAWAATLVSVFEKKPFDIAQRTWVTNEAHIEDAYKAGSPHAAAVEAAWRKREAASKDTARGG